MLSVFIVANPDEARSGTVVVTACPFGCPNGGAVASNPHVVGASMSTAVCVTGFDAVAGPASVS
jgi:hypothetical protein